MPEQKDLLVGGGGFACRVSSVLNRNVKEYGKKFLFDGREDTCWNSDQGSPQWVLITFEEEASVSKLRMLFQGGFAGKNCHLEVSKDGASFEKCFEFYPEDSNKLQTFELERTVTGKAFKVVFSDSSDFFGRVTIYQLELLTPM